MESKKQKNKDENKIQKEYNLKKKERKEQN